MSRYFQIGDSHFGVRTTSVDFGEWLDYALADYRVDRQTDFTYSIVLGSDDKPGGSTSKGFNIFYWGTVPVVRTLHLPRMVDSFLTELETILLSTRQDRLYLRSVPVTANGNTGLLPLSLFLTFGDRGRQARKAGLSFDGTMTVSLDIDSGRISPVDPQLGLPADARARLTEIAPIGGVIDRAAIARATDVDVVYTTTRPGVPEPPGLQAVSRATTLYRMAPWILNLEAVGSAAFDGLRRMLEGSRCYALGPVVDLPHLFGSLATGLNGRVSSDGDRPGSS